MLSLSNHSSSGCVSYLLFVRLNYRNPPIVWRAYSLTAVAHFRKRRGCARRRWRGFGVPFASLSGVLSVVYSPRRKAIPLRCRGEWKKFLYNKMPRRRERSRRSLGWWQNHPYKLVVSKGLRGEFFPVRHKSTEVGKITQVQANWQKNKMEEIVQRYLDPYIDTATMLRVKEILYHIATPSEREKKRGNDNTNRKRKKKKKNGRCRPIDV